MLYILTYYCTAVVNMYLTANNNNKIVVTPVSIHRNVITDRPLLQLQHVREVSLLCKTLSGSEFIDAARRLGTRPLGVQDASHSSPTIFRSMPGPVVAFSTWQM